MDNPRPTSVTVISIIVIVLNALGLFGQAAALVIFHSMAGRPEMAQAQAQISHKIGVSLPFLMGFGIVEAVIAILLGIFMLKGCNWARQLFILIQGAQLVAGWILVGFQWGSVFGVIILGVFVYFLTRPNVVAYFTYEPSPQVSVPGN